jgi:hypothetical protein
MENGRTPVNAPFSSRGAARRTAVRLYSAFPFTVILGLNFDFFDLNNERLMARGAVRRTNVRLSDECHASAGS